MTTTKKTKTILTADQKDVLKYMDRHNIGAVIFEGSYRFPQSFRNDPAMATRFMIRQDELNS